jgi:hypothetical protein
MSNREFSLQFGIYTGPYEKMFLSPIFSTLGDILFWICEPKNVNMLLTKHLLSMMLKSADVFKPQLFLVDHISKEIDSSLIESGFFEFTKFSEFEAYFHILFDLDPQLKC